MLSTGSFWLLYFFTSEIFPTSCRNSLLSFCSTVGRFGSMLAAQTPLLVLIQIDSRWDGYLRTLNSFQTDYYKFAPHLLFATFALLSSILATFLPETANKALPTTLEEARALDKSKPAKQSAVLADMKTAV